MKEAIQRVCGLQLLKKVELAGAKVLHRKGEKYLCGFMTYKKDLFYYNGFTFNSLIGLSKFVGKAISIDNRNIIWVLPQVIVFIKESFTSGYIKPMPFESDEVAERNFNRWVEKFNLKIND